MLKSRLTLIATMAAVVTGGGIAYFVRPAAALADYTPPDLVDAQTFPLSARVGRLGGGRFGCHVICRSAEAGGVRPRGCNLFPGMDAGTYVAAGVECITESVSECTAQAAHECASPAQL